MMSCDETSSVYEESFRKSRRLRHCEACSRDIPKGVKYAHIYIVGGDGAWGIDRCGACQRTHEHLRDLVKGTDRYYWWPAELLDCGESYEDEWGDVPPEIAALAFMTDEEAGKLLEVSA